MPANTAVPTSVAAPLRHVDAEELRLRAINVEIELRRRILEQGALRSFELSQQPLRFRLRQSSSNHRLRYLLGGLAIKLMAFGKVAFI
jgi:hypothetical protein